MPITLVAESLKQENSQFKAHVGCLNITVIYLLACECLEKCIVLNTYKEEAIKLDNLIPDTHMVQREN